MDRDRKPVYERKTSKKEIDSYTPSSLRKSSLKRRQEMWGIGIRYAPYEFGMIHGPFKTEADALEVVGEKRACIIHFRSDGTDEVVWYWRKNQWKKRKR